MNRYGPLLASDSESGAAARRAGSVQLRQGGSDDQDPLDPANRSLADALNVMFAFLKVAMAGLGIAFILSGFQRVNEGEQGIRLLFGRVQQSNLEPGLRWSAPYPIGQLIRVGQQGVGGVSIDKDFWVSIPEGAVDPSPDKLAPTQSLKPDQANAGYIIAGDGNIAHTKWSVSYKRADVEKYANNVLESDERDLVRAAVRRGAVHACARVAIEDLLKQGSATSSVALVAKDIAQQTLDRMGSGLKVDQCSLEQVIAPLWVRRDFEKVAAEVSNAAKARDKAQTDRATRLNEIGGRASVYLVGEASESRRVVGLITRYETAIAAADKAGAEAALTQIEGVLEGTPVEIEVETRDASGAWVKANERVEAAASGEIATRLQDARRYRSEVVNNSRGKLARFEAKLAQYKANPSLMVQREWSTAMRDFLARDSVQVLILPPGSKTLTLKLNSDPDILKEIDQARRIRENEMINNRRRDELRRGEYKTNTDLQETPG
ncbi:MAG: SPFH domain-containing protein [Phycisphaerales bacterium]